MAAFEAGLQVNVPVMIGTVQTEGLIFVKKVLKAPISGLKFEKNFLKNYILLCLKQFCFALFLPSSFVDTIC